VKLIVLIRFLCFLFIGNSCLAQYCLVLENQSKSKRFFIEPGDKIEWKYKKDRAVLWARLDSVKENHFWTNFSKDSIAPEDISAIRFEEAQLRAGWRTAGIFITAAGITYLLLDGINSVYLKSPTIYTAGSVISGSTVTLLGILMMQLPKKKFSTKGAWHLRIMPCYR